jgi:hypothetical protein
MAHYDADRGRLALQTVRRVRLATTASGARRLNARHNEASICLQDWGKSNISTYSKIALVSSTRVRRRSRSMMTTAGRFIGSFRPMESAEGESKHSAGNVGEFKGNPAGRLAFVSSPVCPEVSTRVREFAGLPRSDHFPVRERHLSFSGCTILGNRQSERKVFITHQRRKSHRPPRCP